MKFFDCTLRDGANVVGNGFSVDLTISMINALISNGITDIEIGNAKGIGAYEKLSAKAPADDVSYITAVKPYLPLANIGMFMLAKIYDEKRIEEFRGSGLSFIRVGEVAGNGKSAVNAVRAVKKNGFFCRYSLMRGYVLSAQQLADEATMLQNEGVDAITIMDSAGTMYPDEVKEYVEELKNRLSIPVGFHGHSNLGLSQANALAAAQAGVDEIDCGLLGMARSAGNCATEIAALTLNKAGYINNVNCFGLLDYLENDLVPAMSKYGYKPAVSPEDLILGYAGCHSNYLGIMKQVAKEKGVNLFQLICKVSDIDRANPTEELIRNTAASLQSFN